MPERTGIHSVLFKPNLTTIMPEAVEDMKRFGA